MKSNPNPLSKPVDNLELRQVSLSMGRFRLECDLKIRPGERLQLTSRSGSGKTTLLRAIAGLIPFDPQTDRGEIWLGKTEMTGLPPQQRQVGFLFQDALYFPNWNVLENVTVGLKLRGVPSDEAEKEGLLWLEKVGLRDRAKSGMETLSGGEKQRVAFIRAIIWKPQVILLDEPFSSLDHEMSLTLQNQLLELHQAWPAPLIWVTHDHRSLPGFSTGHLRIEEDQHTATRRVIKIDQRPEF